ncbi:MAG: pyruvate dehydrogenase complex dihydrolipoamide acetyltransferase [Bacteroidetes bacterium]|jgi:pyruvate dehydrogenase E2 component (dihydrolipoamide acetyltransferase)|nr:pyruvate dehydrogenase complex dihydrolipoamide acetyltransferase [Bacteroidota bacterium]
MAEIIRMPRMSDTMEEGNIVEWLKEEGDEVEPGDILAEVETDKATMELESYHEGVLLHIGVKEGAVPVNAVIAVIGEEGEDYESQLKEAEEAMDEGESADDSKAPQDEGDSEDSDDSADPAESKSSGSEEKRPAKSEQDTDRIKASPLAKKMAADNDLSLSDIQGSGDRGRIVKRDIESFLEEQKSAAPSPMPEGLPSREAEEVPISQMRKTIARRLSESKFSSPHFYLNSTIDMDEAIAARGRINEMTDTKISFNDLVVKAAAMALRSHPMVNASWLKDTIKKHKEIHVGVAVAVDEGLLVPVIRNTDLKSLSQINEEVKEKAGRARERKLSTEEMQGNTFTISNLGMFDIDDFTAIINPPDACIMAVGSINEVPVVKNGEIQVGNRMKVTLSCDHRLVDGVTGAKFLQTFKSLLEEPLRMIV